ncbi:hypothetical protein [Nostoc sp. FACHB-133]|uniref:hypothetical protein n=1 Tax=Nostoc sp. FACHB-133 TaxID=2692835 RepID=UPI0016841837|nr:hypothetical protein [Nostoc sp. FACHB-133]MBD2522724.1 hypothetical protein [Nostoc sp. FACHB-133]
MRNCDGRSRSVSDRRSPAVGDRTAYIQCLNILAKLSEHKTSCLELETLSNIKRWHELASHFVTKSVTALVFELSLV